MAVYAVGARPADKAETENKSTVDEVVDARQSWNNQQQPPLGLGYAGPAPGYPVQQPVAGYPVSSASRPAYAYDNAFPDQVDFSHANIASMINSNIPVIPSGFLASPVNPIHQQVSGFVPTGYQAPAGVSASAAVSGRV